MITIKTSDEIDGLFPLELLVLEQRKYSYRLIMGKCCHVSSTFCYHWIVASLKWIKNRTIIYTQKMLNFGQIGLFI